MVHLALPKQVWQAGCCFKLAKIAHANPRAHGSECVGNDAACLGDAGGPQKRQKKSEAANFQASPMCCPSLPCMHCLCLKVTQSMHGMQEDLAALQERDPEFYAYLKQTDSDLLDFSLPADDDDDGGMPAASVRHALAIVAADGPCSFLTIVHLDLMNPPCRRRKRMRMEKRTLKQTMQQKTPQQGAARRRSRSKVESRLWRSMSII